MFRKPRYERKTFSEDVADIGEWFGHRTLAEVKEQLDELIAKYGAEARFWYNNDYYNGIRFYLSTPYREETDAEYQRRIQAEEANYQRQLRAAEHEVNRAKKEGKL